jgi:hypothetical protein
MPEGSGASSETSSSDNTVNEAELKNKRKQARVKDNSRNKEIRRRNNKRGQKL